MNGPDALFDYVSGERFAALADGERVRYCPVDSVEGYFAGLPPDVPPFTLITHNGDRPVTDAQWRARHPRCVRWFSSNAESDHVWPLPLGIANSSWTHGDVAEMEAAVRDASIVPDKLVLVPYYRDTHPLRRQVTDLFRGKPWATVHEQPLPFRDYLDALCSHKVAICPPGRGTDCHRQWEALYCGAAPLIVREGADLSRLPITAAGYQAFWEARCRDSHPELSMAHWRRVIGARPRQRRILAFGLWGDRPKYCQGMLENARLAREVYPGWELCLWYWYDVPQGTITRLEEAGVRCVPAYQDSLGLRARGLWRFLAASAPDCEAICFRDADSRVNWRERAAVDAWLKSPWAFHTMHDHPHHRGQPVYAGMWGVRGWRLPGMAGAIRRWIEQHGTGELEDDQRFLAAQWPGWAAQTLCHTSVELHHGGPPAAVTRPFPPHTPTDQAHVGAIVDLPDPVATPAARLDQPPANIRLPTRFPLTGMFYPGKGHQ